MFDLYQSNNKAIYRLLLPTLTFVMDTTTGARISWRRQPDLVRMGLVTQRNQLFMPSIEGHLQVFKNSDPTLSSLNCLSQPIKIPTYSLFSANLCGGEELGDVQQHRVVISAISAWNGM